jgi:putative glutamine amidotransferase
MHCSSGSAFAQVGTIPAVKPLIGITLDRVEPPGAPGPPDPPDSPDTQDSPGRRDGVYQAGPFVGRSVARAGGVPVLMTPDPQLAGDYADACRGFVFTGGLDPDTAEFGEPMHPKARKMDPVRQAFELALLEALGKRCDTPVLGICLGMQMMALHAGGRLNQYMPDTHEDPAAHQKGADHPIRVTVQDSVLGPSDMEGGEAIHSAHQQAVSDPGRMRVVAVAGDGTVEAIDGQPIHGGRFYLGVQWHPERGGDGPLNLGLFERLVGAARASR